MNKSKDVKDDSPAKATKNELWNKERAQLNYAIWVLASKLATAVNAELEKGNTVLMDSTVIKNPFVIDEAQKILKRTADHDRVTHYIHNGTTPAWGVFKTQKEVRDFFSKRIQVLQPVEWMPK